jgi:hypothetical protein
LVGATGIHALSMGVLTVRGQAILG